MLNMINSLVSVIMTFIIAITNFYNYMVNFERCHALSNDILTEDENIKSEDENDKNTQKLTKISQKKPLKKNKTTKNTQKK